MSEQNLEIVRKGYEAFGRGDIPALIALLDENVSWTTPGPADLPTAGRRQGHSGVQEFFTTLVATFEITRFEPRQFLAQGDTVVVLGDDTSTVRAASKSIEFRWAHVFTVRNGKIVAFEEIGDSTAAVEAIRAAQVRV